jgi:hypothetical protein
MECTKKGQANAAILVALIAALIILYVLFLPPAERARLLGESSTDGPTNPGNQNMLFSSTVGRVYVPGQPSITHDLPAVAIRALESGSILASRDTVTASNNVFEKNPNTILFSADPVLTRNAVLSMNLQGKTGGNIIVELNGQEIYNQDIHTRSVAPIALPNLEQNNNLTFKASTVGFSFWRTNKYTVSGVKITADVKDLSGASSHQSFTLAADEFNTIQTAKLAFMPVCSTEGRVKIMLNGLDVFNGIPDCGGMNTLDLAPARLKAEENTISFSTTDADIVLDRAAVITTGKRQENRLFRFVIDPNRVQGRAVNLRVAFADAATKNGVIKVNGNTIPLRGGDVQTIPITSYIRPGENTIQFEAQEKDFEIVKFDVSLA